MLTKMVNGVEVVLSAAEEAWIRAEWEANASKPPAIPSVTMRQARLALLSAGLLQNVTTAINSLPSPQKEAAQIEWEYSQEVHRDKPFVAVLAGALGLTDTQLDNLFLTASTL